MNLRPWLPQHCAALGCALLSGGPTPAAADTPEPPGSLRAFDLLAAYDADSHDAVFEDDFDDPLDRARWTYALGVSHALRVGPDGHVAPALRMRREPSQRRPAELRSATTDLSALSCAELRYWLDMGQTSPGALFRAEYLSLEGGWRICCEYVTSEKPAGAIARRVLLPADALHAAFRLRFRAAPSGAADEWFLGAVAVGPPSAPLVRLDVDVRPARPADVLFADEDQAEAVREAAPFSRETPAGQRVFLMAPARVGEQVFGRWIVNDRLASEVRLLALTPERDTAAVAFYRPADGAAPIALRVDSDPGDGMRALVGLKGEMPPEAVLTDDIREFLPGETLTLVAERDPAGLVFVAWRVDGVEQGAGEARLELLAPASDLVATAEYALLGDMNADRVLDGRDVDLFILALGDPQGFAERCPDVDRVVRGDVNGDGLLDAGDIDGFVQLMTGE